MMPSTVDVLGGTTALTAMSTINHTDLLLSSLLVILQKAKTVPMKKELKGRRIAYRSTRFLGRQLLVFPLLVAVVEVGCL
jgi:hypothetical protein